jgi:glycosyltransferase involved in cell wall biosynthesis
MRLAIHVTPLANRIVSVSEGTADDFVRMSGISRDRIQVIYNPVLSPSLLRRATEPLDHPWFQEGQPPVIVGVGRLIPQKDFRNLICAFALLRKSLESRLLILGEGEQRSMLEGLVRELDLGDSVSMPGVSPNPYAYLKRASLFTLSSACEALPTVLIEAMGCGCPVVSTNCPNGPSEILRGGAYGALVPVGDSRLLADAMLRSLQSSRHPFPPEALQAYESEYVGRQYAKLIREMISRP